MHGSLAKRRSKSRRHIKLYDAQINQLGWLYDPVLFPLFVALSMKSSAYRGRAFELPTRDLREAIPGLRNATRLRARLLKLELVGLISITVRPSKPMLIQVAAP